MKNNLPEFFRKIDKLAIYLFLMSFFFFKIPNFYIFPFLKNAFLTTQALSRVCFILLFVYECFKRYMQNEVIFTRKQTKTVGLILLFFSVQSMSVLSALNIVAFLTRYKDIVLGILSLFLFYFYRKHYKKIIFILFVSAVLNLVYKSIILVNKNFFVNVISGFIYQKHFELVLKNIDRGRILTDTYDEIITPFLFLLGEIKIIRTKIIYFIILLGTMTFSLISNIRTNILMLLVGLVGGLIIFGKIAKKKLLLFMFMLFFLSYIINTVMVSFNGFSFLDRLILQDKIEDVDTITFRIKQTGTAIEMGKNILGLGLGNYYDNLPARGKYRTSTLKWPNFNTLPVDEYIENIFGSILAESGFISLGIFILILIVFIRNDLIFIKQGKGYEKAFVVSFWILFAYGMVNPPVPGAYQVLFWGIRGLLI